MSKVKGHADIQLQVRKSVYGPVITDVITDYNKKITYVCMCLCMRMCMCMCMCICVW